MNEEDAFVRAIAEIETANNPDARLGDHGRAAGRFQQHPSFYASWQPTVDEIRAMHEPTWDECYEHALRKFWRKRPATATPVATAVAYHLHGQHIYRDDDPRYHRLFDEAWQKFDPSNL